MIMCVVFTIYWLIMRVNLFKKEVHCLRRRDTQKLLKMLLVEDNEKMQDWISSQIEYANSLSF